MCNVLPIARSCLILGQVLVWKELDYTSASDTDKQMLVSEVNLLRELKHEHIVRYVDRIIDRKQSMLYLVMEYCEGGDLASYIGRMRKEGFVFINKLTMLPSKSNLHLYIYKWQTRM